MIQVHDTSAMPHAATTASLPLTVLLLFELRLEREAYTALVEKDVRMRPVAAPNISTAGRMLSELGNPQFVVLMGQGEMSPTVRRALREFSPLSVVVLRNDGTPSPRPTDAFKLDVVCRDSPWPTVSRLLLSGVKSGADSLEQQSRRIDESGENILASLTRRERQVLELVAGGASVRECSESLHIAISTVDNHKSRLMKKIGVRKSSELVRFAFRVGIAP